jgi:eukaryotic-like serine/threonine-protein kinase
VTLVAGARLGPYEIVAPIGAGGMGEVYRARDTRLGRDVAIKVLPAEFAEDPERLRRFEQEARAVAALDHPNILAIHDVGTHEGAPYIVTELLEGESLRDRLGGGALQVRKAFEIAVQIAQGLAAAHEKGIVHRDLKPGNVFITKDGQVKILDFGLAKLAPSRTAEEKARATTVIEATKAGTMLGTVGYMSPEQIRGLSVDHRTDIFSFGCVLYEMLSGRSPFRKETTAETMTAILNEDPSALTGNGREFPPVLQGIVSRCLEKNPQDRFHAAHDLALDLALLARTSETSTRPGPELVKSPRRVRRWITVSAALIGAAVLVLGAALLGRGWSKAPTVRCERLTYRRGFVTGARFAADGRTVVYSATWDGAPSELFSLRLGNPESNPLGYSHAELLAVSPTDELALVRNPLSPWSRWHPLLRTGTTFAVAPFSGGTPRDLDAAVKDADYSPDGRTMAVLRLAQTGVQLEYPIGTVRATGQLAGELFLCPRVSPDGTRVAFFHEDEAGRAQVRVVDTGGGSPRVLAEDLKDNDGLAWSPSGNEVWYTDKSKLWAVTLSGRKRVVYSHTMRLTLQDVARDGRVLVTTWDRRLRNFYRGPGDTADRELTWLDWSIVSDLSEDGRLIAFFESEEGARFKNVSYLRGTDGSPPVKLGEGAFPGLSSDGRFAVTVNYEKNGLAVYPVGPGAARTVLINGLTVGRPALLPDDTTVCFSGSESSHSVRLWLTDLAGSKPRPVTPEGSIGTQRVWGGGRYAHVNLDGANWLYPLPSGEPRRMAGVQKDDWIAAIGADGQSAFVYLRQQVPIKVYKVDLRTGGRVLFREIPLSDQAGANINTPPVVRMTSDGRSYICTFSQQLSDLYVIEGLK